jgi:hypothetical protein
MPIQLRANLGNRLILRVDSESTAEIVRGSAVLRGCSAGATSLRGPKEVRVWCTPRRPSRSRTSGNALAQGVGGEVPLGIER